MDCSRCELRAGCLNVVWGKGPVGARYMFVGEYPTDEDELMEEPFMSREGKLFRSLLSKSGINPADCYFTFAVKCRVDKDLTTSKRMKSAKVCRHWLDKEIAQLKPQVVVTLGRLPTSLLLNLKYSDSLESVVGQKAGVVSADCPIFPWYSPSYIIQHGKKSDAATITFLNKLKESVNVLSTNHEHVRSEV